MKKLIFGIIIITMISCAPRVTTNITKSYPTLDFNKEVYVFDVLEEAPESAIEVGTVKVDDTGFSVDCGYDDVIDKAKMEARKAGGNAIKIIYHLPPNSMTSSCDRISATIFKIDNIEDINKIKKYGSPLVDSTWNYAKLYVYRAGYYGALIGYDLYLGDSVICRVKNNSKYEIKITKKGLNTLWAKTEVKVEVPMDIKFGQEYYLNCSIVNGIMIGRPQLILISRKQGKIQYNLIED